MEVLSGGNGKVISKTEIAPGIYEIEYQLPKGASRVPEKKTVYDPKVYSDQQMATMSQEAANKAMISYQINGKTPQKINVNGVDFIVPFKPSPSGIFVPTVYPGRLP